MSLKKIQAIGSPFNLNYSSSGTIKPKLFEWTNTEQEYQVYIDGGMSIGLNKPNHSKKFGWFCESRIVKINLYNHIKNNLIQYRNSYNKIFTCDSELINLDPTFFIFNYAGSNLPWTPRTEYGLHKKTKLTSFLCSKSTMTEGHRYRLSYAEKFKDKVDLYGGACGSKQIGTESGNHYHHKKKTEALNDYCFSFTFENNKYDTYFTEKITDCFANGVIPIYYGTKKISDIFDSNGIIFFDDNFNINTLTNDLYHSKIDSVKNNFNIITQMENSDDMLIKNIWRLQQ